MKDKISVIIPVKNKSNWRLDLLYFIKSWAFFSKAQYGLSGTNKTFTAKIPLNLKIYEWYKLYNFLKKQFLRRI